MTSHGRLEALMSKRASNRIRRLGAPPIALILGALLAMLAGCERSMRDMYDQPRLDPDAASALFADGRATRAPPAGSLPMAVGDLAQTSGGRRGRMELAERAMAEDALDLAQARPALTMADLERGQARFDVYCAPCHSRLGDGDGLVARRGFPHPPSFHQARLRAAADRHFYDVMTRGYGAMRSYADRLTPEDRWAVVAWIRTLQLARAAPVGEVPAPVRAALRDLPAPVDAAPREAVAPAPVAVPDASARAASGGGA